MKKKTLLVLYGLALLGSGVAIAFLGSAFAGIESITARSGGEEFVSVFKLMGAGFGLAGTVGLAWAVALSENPVLSGYAGLNRAGVTTFAFLFFFLGGPFWLLIGWTMWWLPLFKAHAPTRRD